MTINGDVARLYHLHSSYVRGRLVDRLDGLFRERSLDDDRRPLRFRTYPGSRRVDLGARDFRLPAALGTVLKNRNSVRDFRPRALALSRVARLLHAGYGVRGYRGAAGWRTYDRPCPSAGGLYPLELYVAAQRVRGLPDGLYHYDARAHQLELRRSRSVHDEVARTLPGPDIRATVRAANLVIVMTAIFDRTTSKYGERGYRYVWLEAGHAGQNLYLAATALRLGAVGLGAFFDDELNRVLGLPSGEEEAIYIVCVGQPRDAKTGVRAKDPRDQRGMR